ELGASGGLRSGLAGRTCCAHEDQAGGGGPSYSRTRNLPTVSSSTSSAWKRAFLTVTRPSASRPIASAPTATAPNAAAPIASAIMLVAGTASARRANLRGIDGLRQGLVPVVGGGRSRRRPATISDVSRTNRNGLPAGGGAIPICRRCGEQVFSRCVNIGWGRGTA